MLAKSKWPVYIRVRLFTFLYGAVYFLLKINSKFLSFRGVLVFCGLYGWFKRLSRERDMVGSVNIMLRFSLKFGFILFLLSEVIFFISFFWSYFHFIFLVSPDLQGMIWPPYNLGVVSYTRLALLNTIFLLARGYSLTNRHVFFYKDRLIFVFNLYVTLLLGASFLFTQILEYNCLRLVWRDRAYCRIFYVATGFHGTHVGFGFIFLLLNFFNRSVLGVLIFEIAAWYWHFVDVIWLFLFIFFYWLNSW